MRHLATCRSWNRTTQLNVVKKPEFQAAQYAAFRGRRTWIPRRSRLPRRCNAAACPRPLTSWEVLKRGKGRKDLIAGSAFKRLQVDAPGACRLDANERHTMTIIDSPLIEQPAVSLCLLNRPALSRAFHAKRRSTANYEPRSFHCS